MEEDLMKLRDMLIQCDKPDPNIMIDDKNYARADVMAIRALHITAKLPKNNISLQSLIKQLIDHTKHVWHEDEEFVLSSNFEGVQRI